jgi:hypothetical protein
MPQYSGALTSPFNDVYPGPYLTVRISWNGNSADRPGLIDSGADLSFVPNDLVSVLGMQKVSELPVRGIRGPEEDQDTYIVRMEFHGFSFASVEVATIDYPFCLIGRDVLSDLVTELDGPGLQFKLSRS